MERTHNKRRVAGQAVGAVLLVATFLTLAMPNCMLVAGQSWTHLAPLLVLLVLAGPVGYLRLLRAGRRMQETEATPTKPERMAATTTAVLCTGLVFTLAASQAARQQVVSEARARFDRLTEHLIVETEQRLYQLLHGLRAVAGLYAANQHVSRRQLESFATELHIHAEFPGALGLGFIEPVQREQLGAFERHEQQDGWPTFGVHGLPSEHGSKPPHETLFVIKHVFPRAGNEPAWGLDVGSETRRREAVLRAMRTGQPTITRSIQLVQDSKQRSGFLYFLPVYRTGAPVDTVAEREAAFLGLAYMPIVLEGALDGVFSATEGHLDFEVFDGEVPRKDNQLFDHDHHLDDVTGLIEEDHFADRLFSARRLLSIGGRNWTMSTSSLPSFEATIDPSLPVMIAGGGTLMSLMLAGMVWSLWVSRWRNVALDRARVTAEDAVRGSKTLVGALNGHSIVSETDREGTILGVNDEFCRISGYSREELVGSNHRIVNSGMHPREFWAGIWANIGSGKPWTGEICNRRKTGSLYWVHTVIAPALDAEGRVEKYISIRHDITARKQYEEQILRSAALIEEKNRELVALADRAHRVVDDVSHEFRTPLAVIKEFASIIGDGLAGPVTAQQSQYLRIVAGAVGDLNHMVEDLLDSSKLRAGRLRVDRRPHSIASIFAAGRTTLARKASTRSILVEESIEDGLPEVFADEEKVRRVISNLMTNAIKFSPENGIIKLSAARGEHDGEVVVRVTDQGPGLSPEDVEQLFGRFQQVSTARSVSAKGFGLGLSIAQELAWLNLGRLSVTTEKGKGATFWFTLPVNEEYAILEHYFETIGCTDLPDQQIALVRADAHDCLDPEEPHGFLASITYPTDLVLPVAECTGAATRSWWLLGRTRSVETWTKRLREARHAQFMEDGIKVAPLEVNPLGHWQLPAGAATARECAIRTITRRSHMTTKVLIIDDEWTIQQALRARLAANGFEVLVAGDGPSGIETARESRPDVILLDLRMPDIDGFEVLRRLRASDQTARIPVVFLTANVLDTVRQQAKSAGAAGFLAKPYDAAAVIDCIRTAAARTPEPAGR